MTTAAASVSRWARRFMAVSVLFLVGWRAAALVGLTRRTAVVLGVLGFVLHAVFGKAHSLVPSYFDRQLATPRTPPIALALTAPGVVLLAADAEVGVPLAGTLGSVLWTGGVAVFLGTILWTIRDNPLGSETGTGEANAERRPVDRAANAFVPVALAYLALGTYGTLALETPLPGIAPAAVSHLLAAGAAAVLVFAIGFRLLPRFLVAAPPKALVYLVLSTGALGPAIIAGTLYGGAPFAVGALLEAVAVVGFALVYATLFVRSDRRRIGFYGVLAGATCGVLGVLLGLSFALVGPDAALAAAHVRLNVLGFLGLSIVGVTYQFYPPTVGSVPGATDRTAAAAIAALAGGLLLEVIGIVAGAALVATAGRVVALLGASLHAYLLLGAFAGR